MNQLTDGNYDKQGLETLDPKKLLPGGAYEQAQKKVNEFSSVEEAYKGATSDPDSRAVKAILHL